MEMDYKNQIKEKVVQYFKNYEADLFLFGSRARGDARPRSDFDIGYSSTPSFAIPELQDLREEFENSDIPYRIDLINFDTSDEDFKSLALKKVEIWKKKRQKSLFE